MKFAHNHGSSERISIALDIFVKKQVLLMYFGGAGGSFRSGRRLSHRPGSRM